MPSGEATSKSGRPPNVNKRELTDALQPILSRMAALENPAAEDSAGQPLPRGVFFLHLMAGMCIHRGEAAFNPQFLDTVRNNADDFYEAYCQISTGDFEVQSTTRQLLDDAQQRLDVVNKEKEDLAARARELEEEALTLRAHTEAVDA